MEVVRDESPCKAASGGFGEDGADPGEKGVSVGIVAENVFPFYPTADDVMERTWRIYASLSGHVERVPQEPTLRNA